MIWPLIQYNDNTTVAEYSITFYITAELKREVEDIHAWVEERLEEMNTAYRNSGVPLVARLHCIYDTEPGVNESLWFSDEILAAFRRMHGRNPELLLKTADATVLVVNRMTGCGGAVQNGIASN